VLRRIAVLLLAASAVLVPVRPAAAADTAAQERQFLVLLNKQRASAGLGPLVLDPALSAVARGWSLRLAAQPLAHNPALRQSVESSVTRTWSRLGENVGVGADVVGLHRRFWESEPHRRNVLGGYNRVGIGVVTGGDGLIRVTVDFVAGPPLAGATGIDDCRSAGYVLDAFGAVHAAGGAGRLRTSAYWAGWDVARDLGLPAGGERGQVLDAFGGLHPVGGASALRQSGYWPGWDVARAVAVQPGGRGAYVLDAFGGLHPAGAAPRVGANGYWAGRDVARDLQLLPGRADAGYVLDSQGGLKRFGTGIGTPRLSWRGGPGAARSFSFLPSGRGGYVTDLRGDLHPFAVGGASMPADLTSPIPLASEALGALSAGPGAVMVTAGGAEIGVRDGCASPAPWGVRNLVRAVATR
jgi:Cysteine-rich secretory protein family